MENQSSSRIILFTESQIQNAVEAVSWSILTWLKQEQAKGVHLVSVLEGAKPFTRDLMECFEAFSPELELSLHEIKVKGTAGNNLLEHREWHRGQLKVEAMGQHPILIVDDLVDSGSTLAILKKTIETLGIGEVRTAVLVRKFGEASGPVDFCGLELNFDHGTLAKRGLKDCWLFGYGMDDNGQCRELKHIEGLNIPL